MCGICGIVHQDREEPVSAEVVRRMCSEITHRGPDEDGYHLRGAVGMGMRRLSIIDLSGGSQPIYNEDHSLAIVFNGEIYNYLELRQDLEARGHQFCTRADTEVIVHAYEEWGEECPQKLRGMFVFAIHDYNNEVVFIARDRMGKKPLYYFHDARRFVFASEIKALLTHADIPRHLNLAALDAYLSLGYVPAPQTLFAGINKLPASGWLRLKDGEVTLGEYWDLRYTTDPSISYEDARAMLHNLLYESVQVRLMSEVPLGAFLSGGIDSSVVVGIMSQLMNQPVNTFSMGFEGKDLNELPYARVAAKAFGAIHHEIVLQDCSSEMLERIVWHLDEPVADPAAVPTLLLSELARRHVTVVLTGEGGDELFAGYDYYRRSQWANRFKLLPGGLNQRILPFLARSFNRVYGKPYFHDRTIWYWSMPERTQMGAWVAIFTEAEKRALLASGSPLVNQRANRPDTGLEVFGRYYDRVAQADGLHRQMYIDSKVWLPDDLLMKVDKMSMAHSIEARAPYLDHRLFEYVASLPESFKLHEGQAKYIFRQVARDFVPAEIVDRPKHTFDVPIGSWLTGSLSTLNRELVTAGRVAGVQMFNPQVLGGVMMENLVNRQPGVARQFWTLLNLGLWVQKYHVTVA